MKTTLYELDFFQLPMSKLFLSTWSDNEIHENNVFFHCIHYINIPICYHKMLHLSCLEEFWMCLWWIKFISLVLYVQLILFSYSSIKSSRANLNHSMEIINEKYQFSIKVKLFFEFLLLLFRNSKKHQKYFFVSAS